MTRFLYDLLARETHGCFVEDCSDSMRIGAEDNHSFSGSSKDLKHNLCKERVENNSEELHVDILLLTEDDIPGALLNGKSPSQLTVVQLKRWLACHGAPISGKKPDLLER